MPLNLMAGLMAGANFGTGFQQGQQQNVQNQIQQLALQNDQLLYNQNKQNASNQQAMSDYMMQSFNPLGGSPTGQQGTGAPQTPSNPMQDSISQAYKMANFARSHGDVAGYSQWVTQAANLQNAQAAQQDKQVTAQLAESKRQAQHYANAAQSASLYASDPSGFNAWRQSVMQDPMSTPQEREQLANMPYSPDWQQRVSDGAMTAAQKASLRVKQIEQALQERNIDNEIANRNANTAIRARHEHWQETKPPARAKAGQGVKAPTQQQLSEDSRVVAQVLYGDKAPAELKNANNPLLNGPKARDMKDKSGNVTGFTPDENTYGLNYISSEATRLQREVPGLSRVDAVTRATREAVQNGTIHVDPAQAAKPGEHWFDSGTPAKPGGTSVKAVGGKSAPIPLTHSLLQSGNMQPGWYETSKGTHYWTGTGWNDSKGQ